MSGFKRQNDIEAEESRRRRMAEHQLAEQEKYERPVKREATEKQPTEKNNSR